MCYYVSPIQPQTDDAFTGLMYAAGNGRSEVAHLLLASGADPNIQDTVSRVRVGNGTVECERVSVMCHGQHPPPINVSLYSWQSIGVVCICAACFIHTASYGYQYDM